MSVANICTLGAPFMRSMYSHSRMASEYASSPVAQPGTHSSHGAVRVFVLKQQRDDLGLEGIEGLLVAEKTRDANQQVTKQHAGFVGRHRKFADVILDEKSHS